MRVLDYFPDFYDTKFLRHMPYGAVAGLLGMALHTLGPATPVPALQCITAASSILQFLYEKDCPNATDPAFKKVVRASLAAVMPIVSAASYTALGPLGPLVTFGTAAFFNGFNAWLIERSITKPGETPYQKNNRKVFASFFAALSTFIFVGSV